LEKGPQGNTMSRTTFNTSMPNAGVKLCSKDTNEKNGLRAVNVPVKHVKPAKIEDDEKFLENVESWRMGKKSKRGRKTED